MLSAFSRPAARSQSYLFTVPRGSGVQSREALRDIFREAVTDRKDGSGRPVSLPLLKEVYAQEPNKEEGPPDPVADDQEAWGADEDLWGGDEAYPAGPGVHYHVAAKFKTRVYRSLLVRLCQAAPIPIHVSQHRSFSSACGYLLRPSQRKPNVDPAPLLVNVDKYVDSVLPAMVSAEIKTGQKLEMQLLAGSAETRWSVSDWTFLCVEKSVTSRLELHEESRKHGILAQFFKLPDKRIAEIIARAQEHLSLDADIAVGRAERRNDVRAILSHCVAGCQCCCPSRPSQFAVSSTLPSASSSFAAPAFLSVDGKAESSDRPRPRASVTREVFGVSFAEAFRDFSRVQHGDPDFQTDLLLSNIIAGRGKPTEETASGLVFVGAPDSGKSTFSVDAVNALLQERGATLGAGSSFSLLDLVQGKPKRVLSFDDYGEDSCSGVITLPDWKKLLAGSDVFVALPQNGGKTGHAKLTDRGVASLFTTARRRIVFRGYEDDGEEQHQIDVRLYYVYLPYKLKKKAALGPCGKCFGELLVQRYDAWAAPLSPSVDHPIRRGLRRLIYLRAAAAAGAGESGPENGSQEQAPQTPARQADSGSSAKRARVSQSA
jgi:hypothetical protein